MITLVLSDTDRSFLYLKKIIENKIKFKRIILYSKKYGSVYKLIVNQKLRSNLIFLKTNNVNSKILEQKFILNKSKINIISTYPGEIIKSPVLLKGKLLHCHPGDIPMFKGSTTIYYTLILKKKICVTIFEVNKKIDSGKILYKKYFKIPKKLREIEKSFDNKIRAITLVEYLKSKKNFKYPRSKKLFLPYYIAHPLIRQIILNKNYLK